MIFKVMPINDVLIQSAYDDGMKYLCEFWSINWVRNRPNILLFDSRAEIDEYKGVKTESWEVAWANNGIIHLLNFNKIGKESVRKYSEKEYSLLIKHELCHLFYKSRSSGRETPRWLNEGLSIYCSGQIEIKDRPLSFVNFLDFYSERGSKVYDESGFVVEALINKFGKEKILLLVSKQGLVKNEKDFEDIFVEVYGFELSYEALNKIYSNNKKAPN